jgi:hypothetical protein
VRWPAYQISEIEDHVNEGLLVAHLEKRSVAAAVGVVLHGQLTVPLLDLFLRRTHC